MSSGRRSRLGVIILVALGLVALRLGSGMLVKGDDGDSTRATADSRALSPRSKLWHGACQRFDAQARVGGDGRCGQATRMEEQSARWNGAQAPLETPQGVQPQVPDHLPAVDALGTKRHLACQERRGLSRSSHRLGSTAPTPAARTIPVSVTTTAQATTATRCGGPPIAPGSLRLSVDIRQVAIRHRTPGFHQMARGSRPPSVGVYWTRQAVCNPAASMAVVQRISGLSGGRSPLAWRNRPVYDGSACHLDGERQPASPT